MPGVRVKGRALLDTLESMRARRGSAAVGQVVASLDPAAREVLGDDVVVSTWYPLEVMTALLAADVKANDGGNESVIVARTEAVIEKQLRGVYRIFIRFGSPESVVKRIAAIHETYFDGVQIERQFLDDRRAVIRYLGFDRQHAIIQQVIVGFYRKALEVSGAKKVTARFTVPVGAGRAAELEIAWE